MLAYLGGFPSCHRVGVDHHYEVARTEACALCRATLVRVGDYHASGGLLYHRAYAAVFAGGHGAELFLLLGGDVFSVRVNVVEHRRYGCVDGLLGIDRVDVESLQLFIQRVEDIEISRYIAFFATCCSRSEHGQHDESGGEKGQFLHIFIWDIMVVENVGIKLLNFYYLYNTPRVKKSKNHFKN